MEKLARRLGGGIAEAAGLEGERREVMIYGFLALFQTSVILLVLLLISVPCGFALEAAIVFLTAGLLRRCTGGAHSSSMSSCTVQSCVVICLSALTARYILTPLSPFVFAAALSAAGIAGFALTLLKAPMDSEAKKINSPQKKKKLKRNSVIAAAACTALSALLYIAGLQYNIGVLMSAAYSLMLALAWQCFTLTSPCASLITSADKILARICR